MHLLHMYICIMYLLCHVMYGLSVIKYIYNPGRDISFPIFTSKEVETKRIGKDIKTINNNIKIGIS